MLPVETNRVEFFETNRIDSAEPDRMDEHEALIIQIQKSQQNSSAIALKHSWHGMQHIGSLTAVCSTTKFNRMPAQCIHHLIIHRRLRLRLCRDFFLADFLGVYFIGSGHLSCEDEER
eukprot:SAG31_NODE_6498_length_1995_cov_0.972574_3_plen_117_part_01